MQVEHFTRDDAIGNLVATIAFPLILVIPGYVLAWASDVLDFRSLRPGWRFVISVPISVSVCPILAYLIDLVAGRSCIWLSAAVCWVIFGYLFATSRLSWAKPSKSFLVFVGIGIAWTAIVLASLVDLQIGDRLYASVTSADQYFRTALTD